MRKNATKIAALALSLALTVTSVNVPTNASAASVKLNKTKATLYLNGPSKKKVSKLVVKGTNKKVTFTSSNKSVVKVNKNGKITAKATGKATITAKVNKKSYKCNVTVKKTYKPVTGITVSPKTVTLNVGKKKTLKTTVKPAKPTNKKVAYTSDKKSVATVSSAGKITAKKAGTAKITVKTKGIDKNNKHKKATVAVTVKNPDAPDASTAPSDAPSTEPSAAPSDEPTTPGVSNGEATVKLTNAFQGEDIILAGSPATFEVTVKDPATGKPAANKTVTVTLEKDKANNATDTKEYELADMVVTTDSDGVATFVVKPKSSGAIANTDKSCVGAYKYTVAVSGSNTQPTEGVLKVAALVYGATDNRSVKVMTEKEKLVPGDNFKEIIKGSDPLRVTTNVNNVGEVEYIGGQQVTTPNADHTVTLKSDVCLAIPGYSTSQELAKRQVTPLDWKSDEYHTYEYGEENKTKHEAALLDAEKLANVDYATVHFNSLRLSKHTSAEVYIIKGDGTPNLIKTYGYDDFTFEGTEGTGAFGLQIEKDQLNGGSKLRIVLRSEGQVNLKDEKQQNNVGYDVKDIEYVFKAQQIFKETVEHLDGVKIEWDLDKDVYYDDEVQVRTNGENVKDGKKTVYHDGNGIVEQDNNTDIADEIVELVKTELKGSETDCWNITYQVPTFPRVGNAIIRCKDKNGITKKIFACATINENGRVRNTNGNGYHEDATKVNKNILYWPNGGNKLFYEITDQEAKQTDATVKSLEQGVVEVNATKSGVSHLVGEITATNPNVAKALDDSNRRVYTSVMWNPVINTTEDAAGIAFAGQTATVVAQLVDENGNPVAKEGQPINWAFPENYSSLDLKEVEKQGSTDPYGQAKLRLTAAKAVELIGVNAATPTGYGVKLMLNGSESKKGADIYWVDLHLAYQASSLKKSESEDATTVEKHVNAGKATASVGETWEYASKLIARSINKEEKFQDGALKDKTVTVIKGIDPSVAKKASSKGNIDLNVEGAPKGSARVSSNEPIADGEGGVIFRLTVDNSPAKSEDVSITLNDGKEYPYIGSGKIAANETLTLDFQFATKGAQIGFAYPNGNKSAKRVNVDTAGKVTNATDEQIVYIQLTDSLGNPIKEIEKDDYSRIKVSVEGDAYIAAIDKDVKDSKGSTLTDVLDYENILANTTSDAALFADMKANEIENNNQETANAQTVTARPKQLIYKSLSKVVGKDGTTMSTEPNKDGILAIKLVSESKDDVVVTASYEKLDGKKAIPVTEPQSMTYSFVDAEKLPAFTFDTKQDKGENRISFDSAKNEIAIAFTNDVLPTSVKSGQFKVYVDGISSLNSNTAVTGFTGKELIVKNVTVDEKDKNKLVIKVEGNLTNLVKGTYFKVEIGDDVIEDSVKYIFTSKDGQKLGTSHQDIVFPLDPKESIADLYTGDAVKKLYDSTDQSASPADWLDADPDDVTEAVELLALIGVELPTAKIENETREYLRAIADYFKDRGIDSTKSLADIQNAAKDAIKEVQSVLAALEDSAKIPNELNKKPKQLGSKALKGAFNPAMDPSITITNTITNATGSALNLKVGITVTGPALGFNYTTTSGSAIGGNGDFTGSTSLVGTLDPKVSGTLGFYVVNSSAAATKDLEVKITITSKYYIMTYILTDFKISKDSTGRDIITGAKIKPGVITANLSATGW